MTWRLLVVLSLTFWALSEAVKGAWVDCLKLTLVSFFLTAVAPRKT